jgi:hypothetical protein
MPLIMALSMVFICENNGFPLRNNRLKMGRKVYTFFLTPISNMHKWHYMAFLEISKEIIDRGLIMVTINSSKLLTTFSTP